MNIKLIITTLSCCFFESCIISSAQTNHHNPTIGSNYCMIHRRDLAQATINAYNAGVRDTLNHQTQIPVIAERIINQSGEPAITGFAAGVGIGAGVVVIASLHCTIS